MIEYIVPLVNKIKSKKTAYRVCFMRRSLKKYPGGMRNDKYLRDSFLLNGFKRCDHIDPFDFLFENKVHKNDEQDGKTARYNVIVPAYILSVHYRVNRGVLYQQTVKSYAEGNAENKPENGNDNVFAVDIGIHFSVGKAENFQSRKFAVSFDDIDV